MENYPLQAAALQPSGGPIGPHPESLGPDGDREPDADLHRKPTYLPKLLSPPREGRPATRPGPRRNFLTEQNSGYTRFGLQVPETTCTS